MIWPPVKAWTKKISIDGQKHFIAINYGVKDNKRWVVLMSVLDSNLVVKVSWSELVDPSNWECGWSENNDYDSTILVANKGKNKTTNYTHPSIDSGLTIPITENIIRPWFANA